MDSHEVVFLAPNQLQSEDNDMLLSIEKIDKQIQEVKKKKSELQKRQRQILDLIEEWHKDESELAKKKKIEDQKKNELKNEDPEVEYRRRLVERFSYKNTDLINRIYAENKAKAKASHDSLKHLNYNQEHLKMPLYNQPSDLVQYHENIEKYKAFRPRLIKFLQLKRQKELQLERHLSKEYEVHMTEWLKKLEKLENNPKKKQKQQRHRQFYEHVFPEIKKQREQQERFERLGSRGVQGFTRSEAEVQEIADNLKEMDSTRKQMRLLAVQPPHLLSKYERRLKYINTNGLIRNLEQFEKEHKSKIIWNDNEKQTFREKFSAFPKDFEKIASYMERKSCADCVLFYYQNKKKVYFKSSKLKKKKPKKTLPLKKTTATTVATSTITTATKLDYKESIEIEVEEDYDDEEEDEEQTDEEQEATTTTTTTMITDGRTTESDPMTDRTTLTMTATTRTTIPMISTGATETATSLSSESSDASSALRGIKTAGGIVVKVFNTRSKANAAANSTTSNTSENATDLLVSTISKPPTELSTKDTLATPAVQTGVETPKAPLKMTIIVTSPSNIGDSTSTMSVASIVSETVTAAAAGILTEQTRQSAFLPTEVSAADITMNQLNQVEELIKQHLNKMPEHSDPSRWSESEMMKAVDGLKRFGRNWNAISKLVETKSEAQCKNFYFNYKKKFQLESILGISKGKEKEETSTEQENEVLIPYLEELERQEQVEKQKQETVDKQKVESKPAKIESRTKGSRSRSTKSKSNDNQISIEDRNFEQITSENETTIQDSIQELTKAVPVIDQGEKAPHAHDLQTLQVQVEDIIKNNAREVQIKTTIQQAATTNSPLLPTITTTREGQELLTSPPPLVVCNPVIETESKPIEVCVLENVDKYNQILDPTMKNEQILIEPNPLIRSKINKHDMRTPVTKSKEYVCPQLSPDYPHAVTMLSQVGSTNQFFDSSDRRLKVDHINLPPQAIQIQEKRTLSNPKSDKNVAIEAFHSYTGFMSLPGAPGTSQGELPVRHPGNLPSPRFSFQLPSPVGAQVRGVTSHSRAAVQHLQPRMHAPHNSQLAAQIAASTGMNQSNLSPVISQNIPGAGQYSSPPKPEIIFASQVEEINRQRELEFIRRHQMQSEDMLRQEIEAEREAQMKYRQKELEMHHIEVQYRKQDQLKFLKMQQLEMDRRQEFERRREARLRELEKEKEEMIRKRLFAEKILEDRPMSEEMVHALMRRHFGPYPGPNPEIMMDLRSESRSDFGSHEDIRKLVQEKAREQQYLIKLPHHPRSHHELSQRAASIPDLRISLHQHPAVPDSYLKDVAARLRSNSEHRSVIPEDKVQEFYPREANANKSYQSPLASSNLYDIFGEPNKGIVLPEVPLEPLSRPGSANSDKNDSLTERPFGISIGLTRKPPPLTSIGGQSSIPSLSIKSDKQFVDPRRSQSPHDPHNVMRNSSKRKTTIVRPWEIGSDIQKIKPQSPTLSSTRTLSPAPLLVKSSSPSLVAVRTQSPGMSSGNNVPAVVTFSKHHPPANLHQPVIQLASTSNQFKEQIISLAQRNSPAPQMFPKFNFNVPAVEEKDEFSASDLNVYARKRSVRSSSEQSLSPTFPMPVTHAQTAPQKTVLRGQNQAIVEEFQHADLSHPRSDSEETISADEVDSKEVQQAKAKKQSNENSRSAYRNISLTQDRSGEALRLTNIDLTPNVLEAALIGRKIYSTGIEQEPTLPISSLLMQRLKSVSPKTVSDGVIPPSIEGVSSDCKLTASDNSSVTLKKSHSDTSPGSVSCFDTINNRTKSLMKDSKKEPILSSKEDAIQEPKPFQATPITKSKPLVVTPMTSRSHSTHPTQVPARVKRLKEPPVESHTIKDRSIKTVVSKESLAGNSNKALASSNKQPKGGSCALMKTEERSDSPDIYDDLKVYGYEELHGEDSTNDLYSEMKPTENDELLKLTAKENSPSRDSNLFIVTDLQKFQMEQDNEKTLESVTATEEKTNTPKLEQESYVDKEMEQINKDTVERVVSEKTSEEKFDRSNASTPVQDEPQSTMLLSTTAKRDSESPSSLPEVKTPLLDEPEYSFDTNSAPAVEPAQVDYLKYTNQPAYQVVAEETKSNDLHVRLDYLRAFEKSKPATQEVFESITPPSSPERNTDTKFSTSQTVATSSTSSTVTFPFSALAFNVGSRPASRSSGSGCSPSYSGNRSPLYETDGHFLGENSISSRHRQKRSRDRDDDFEPNSRHQTVQSDVSKRLLTKHNYRQTSSQSASSSFSKSPENDYRSRPPSSARSSPKPPKDAGRKQNRASSSPSDHGFNSKKMRN